MLNDSEQGTRSDKVDDEVLALTLKLLGESPKGASIGTRGITVEDQQPPHVGCYDWGMRFKAGPFLPMVVEPGR
jgi:hypothetical protein